MNKPNIDTRSFREIWDSLTPVQQFEVRNNTLASSYVTESAFRNWRCGFRTPQLRSQMDIVAALKKIGINARAEFLFPSK